MNLFKSLFIFLGIFLFSTPLYADDPHIKWKYTETKHFKIIFPSSYQKTAAKIAVFAEKAHLLVTKQMGWVPSGKTTIVVTDYTDMANGSAMVYFRKTIQVFLTMPDDVSELSDFDDWLWILLLHEYTHIVHMDTKGKIQQLINMLFGQIWVPNSIQPSWVLEGLAIYNETRFSSAGRNRGSIYDMYLRSAVLDGKILNLDEISSSPIPFPHGAVVYLYGSRFLWFLANKYGEENFKYMSAYYGSRVVPFGLNTSSLHSFGKTIETTYKEFKLYLKQKYKEQKQNVEVRGLIKGKKLTNSGERKFYPVFNPNNPREILYIGTDGHSPTALKSLQINDHGKVIKHKVLLTPVYAASAPSFKNKNIFFSQIEYYKTVYTFNDLYLYKNGKTQRLTNGKRYAQPAVDPKHNRLAVVKACKGLMSEIILTNLQGKYLKTLIHGKKNERFFTPVFSRDGNFLAYSIMRGSKRDIEIFNIKTKKIIKITSDRALDVNPAWSSDGKYLYFSSDRTGIFNIYAFNLQTKTLYQVTNVLGGAFAPSVSFDDKFLTYVGFNSKGYDIYLMPLNKKHFLPALPSLNKHPYSIYKPTVTTKNIKVYDYNPIPYFLPVMWYADYGLTDTNSFAVSMSGFDPLNHHTWSFSTIYNPQNNVHDFTFNYTYGGYWYPISLELSEGNYFKNDLIINEKYRDYRWNYLYGSLTINAPFIKTIRDNFIGFSSVSLYQGTPEGPYPVFMPDSKIPDLPEQYYSFYTQIGAYYYNIQSSVYALDWEHGEYFAVWAENQWSSSNGNTYDFNAEAIIRRKIPIGNHTVATFKTDIGTGFDKNTTLYSIGGSFTTPYLFVKPWAKHRNAIHGFTDYTLYGAHYYTTNLSLTTPIRWIGKGYSTLPVFFRRISTKIYVDIGDSFYDFRDINTPLTAIGGEINFHLIEGYYIPVYITIGAYKGFGEYGSFGTYFKLNSSLDAFSSFKNIFTKHSRF